MRNLFLSFFALSLFILGGCETDKVQMTDSGYQYESCKDVAGEPGVPGDFIFIHAKLFAGDSLIFDSRDQGKPTPVQIPTAGEPRGQLSPLQDVIALMSIGDSMRFDYPLDSFAAQRPQLPAGVDFVTYDILVTDIMNPQAFEAWRSNEMKMNDERLVDVETLVTQTYSDYMSGALEGKIKRTESGLGYIIHKQGDGSDNEQTAAGTVTIQDTGLITGAIAGATAGGRFPRVDDKKGAFDLQWKCHR